MTFKYKNEVFNAILVVGAMGALMSSSLISALALYCSSYNYPGGHAIQTFTQHYLKMQKHDPSLPVPYIHIDNFAAQTGVTRFHEYVHGWKYSKLENQNENSLKQFTHLISEKPRVEGFSPLIGPIKAFDSFHFAKRRVILKDKIYILQRNDIIFHYWPYEQDSCSSHSHKQEL